MVVSTITKLKSKFKSSSLSELKRYLKLNKQNLVAEKKYLRDVLAHNKRAARDKSGTVIANSKTITMKYKQMVTKRERVVKILMSLISEKRKPAKR